MKSFQVSVPANVIITFTADDEESAMTTAIDLASVLESKDIKLGAEDLPKALVSCRSIPRFGFITELKEDSIDV